MTLSLSALIEKLENASGPSRDLDVEVCNLLIPCEAQAFSHLLGKIFPVKWGKWGDIADQTTAYREAPHITASIDAAVALVKRVLPEASVLMGWSQTPQTLPWARIGPWFAPDATGANQAIALCIAALRALSSREQRNGL